MVPNFLRGVVPKVKQFLKKRPKIVLFLALIFWGECTMCILCIMLLTIVNYFRLSALSMSVMGFPKKKLCKRGG